MTDATLWPHWHRAARDPGIDAALRALYAELDADIAARGPTCWQSGRCCRFARFDHRLYVTGLEIAWFLEQRPVAAQSEIRNQKSEITALPILHDGVEACPYQRDNLCTTHAIRPLGCRIFFCQQGTEQWQQELYETYLARLRRLHDEHGLPYRYMDWLHGLLAAAGTPQMNMDSDKEGL